MAGSSRETCTEVLRDFADHGLIRLARRRITVLDPERLKDASGQPSASHIRKTTARQQRPSIALS
ncbi:helix-turn-helix domain-containing protein [Streptomyces sp. NPDC050803]|uniref:helix-turn-helix domain-containing protein n=1 Tax=unclassified Streptomyces TaxID=2593676 RepID=UPI0034425B80